MSCKPILFNGAMVQAIQAGRKTQTRRVVVPQPTGNFYLTGDALIGGVEGTSDRIRCPYGVPGDKLRMLATWAVHRNYDNMKPTQLQRDLDFVWTAFNLGGKPDVFGKLRPGRFCPLWLRERWMPLAEVEDVRAQQVQEISDGDVVAEGVEQRHIDKNREWFHKNDVHGLAFAELWDSINAKPKLRSGRGPHALLATPHYVSYPWDDIQETREHRGLPWVVLGNPFVWAVTFRKIPT